MKLYSLEEVIKDIAETESDSQVFMKHTGLNLLFLDLYSKTITPMPGHSLTEEQINTRIQNYVNAYSVIKIDKMPTIAYEWSVYNRTPSGELVLLQEVGGNITEYLSSLENVNFDLLFIYNNDTGARLLAQRAK